MKRSKLQLFSVLFILWILIVLNTNILNSNLDQSESKNSNFEISLIALSDMEFPYELCWNQTWGSSNEEYGSDLLIDQMGNVYALGGSLDPEVQNNFDILLRKYNSKGVLQWEVSWGGLDYDWGNDIKLNSQGNIIIAGTTKSYGEGGYNVVLICYDENGTLLWEKLWGTSLNEFTRALVIDESNNIIISGRVYDDPNFENLLLAKFDPVGNPIWDISWGNSSNAEAAGDIAIDSNGNLCIVGGCGTAPYFQLLIMKFDSNGNILWRKIYGSFPDYYFGLSVILDIQDNLYITGYKAKDDLYYTRNRDTILLKYDSNGNLEWSRVWDRTKYDSGVELIFDRANNIIIACKMHPESILRADMALICYDKNGNFRWEFISENSNKNEDPTSIARDSIGNLYLLEERSDYYPHMTDRDLYLAKFNTSFKSPIIELLTPINGTIHNSGKEIIVEITVPDIDAVRYNWDNTEFQAWSTPYITEFPEGNGVHKLFIFANNTYGFNSSQMYQFITDDENDYTPPSVLTNLVNNTTHRSGTIVEIEVSDQNLDTVMYRWDEDNYILCNSIFSTYLPVGDYTHYLYICANDTSGNSFKKAFQYTVDDDTTPPQISLVDLNNNTAYQSRTIIELNISDPNLDTVFYKWDEHGYSTLEYPYTTQLPEGFGNHQLSVFANDTWGNKATLKFQFTALEFYKNPYELNPLIIDGNGNTGYSWEQLLLGDLCSGSGTLNDPYVIQNIKINGNGVTDCLTIINSTKHFIIKNCQFYNSGNANSGISLFSIENYQVYNCTFLNTYIGISLDYCYSGSISNNQFYNNILSGISINNSHYNNIFENILIDNGQGINLKLSTYNAIQMNNLSNNSGIAVQLEYSDKNEVRENAIYNNLEGIYLINSNLSYISDNYIALCKVGIHLYKSNENTIARNQFELNDINISMEDCNSNIFINSEDIPDFFNFPFGIISIIITVIVSIVGISLIVKKKSKKLLETRNKSAKSLRNLPNKVNSVSEVNKACILLKVEKELPSTILVCNHCGEEIESPASFCHRCGKKLDFYQERKREESKFYCEFCGTKIVPEARYCVQCGHSIYE